MNWFSGFWSKGKNRAFIYSFGFLIILGSYVIGSPDRPASNNPIQKLKAKTVSKSQVQDVEPIKPTETQETAVPHETVTPQTVSIPAATTANEVSPPLSSLHEDAPPSFAYPVNQMKVSDEVKKKIVERLLEGPKEYPYASGEQDEEAKKELAETKSWDVAGSRNIKNKKENDDKKKTPLEQKKDAKLNGSQSKSTWYAGASKALVSNESKTSDQNTESNAEDSSNDEEYDPAVQNPTPSWLANFYNHVHVFSFKKGVGGTTKFPTFNLDQEAEYTSIRPVIFSPPDWQLGWEKFIKSPLKEAIDTHLLPFGANGVLTLQIQRGYIPNAAGADFMIVENPFCSIVKNGKDEIMQDTVSTLLRMNAASCFPEPAKVEVAEFPQGPFYEFTPCDGRSVETSTACAGVVPQIYKPGMILKNIGGDQFDLSSLKKLPANFKTKYIRITDLNNSSGEDGAKGFDLDSFVPFNLVAEGK